MTKFDWAISLRGWKFSPCLLVRCLHLSFLSAIALISGCHNIAIGRYAEAICQDPKYGSIPCHDSRNTPNVDAYLVSEQATSGPAPAATTTTVGGAALATTTPTSATTTAPTGSTTAPPAGASASTSPSTPTTGLMFQDRGQAQYIRSTEDFINRDTKADSTKKLTLLHQNFAAELKATPEFKPFVDRTVFHREFVINVSKFNAFNPADRLARTEIFITPRNGYFTSWDLVQTLYTTITPGTITVQGFKAA